MKRSQYVKSPLNYTGGKYRLLSQIIPLFPNNIHTFNDLFVGGANVIINAKAQKYYGIDTNKDIIKLFRYFKNNNLDKMLNDIDFIIDKYNLSNSLKYGYDYYNCNSSSGLSKYNKPKYEKLRNDYNNQEIPDNLDKEIIFYTLLIFSFNNQIRFNKDNNFNMPTGKRDFNKNMKNNFINFVNRLQDIDINFENKSYKEQNLKNVNEQDFFYADPPYLISTATYNESGGWNEIKEKELLNYLLKIHKNGAKFALSNVTEHKNMKNDLLIDWINKNNFYENVLNFKYNNSSYHAKNRNGYTKEVLITNY